jgi:hypothetical protein
VQADLSRPATSTRERWLAKKPSHFWQSSGSVLWFLTACASWRQRYRQRSCRSHRQRTHRILP